MRPFKGFAATVLTLIEIALAALSAFAIHRGITLVSSQTYTEQITLFLSQYHMTPHSALLLALTACKVAFGDTYPVALSAVCMVAASLALSVLYLPLSIIDGISFLTLRIFQKGRRAIALTHRIHDCASVFGIISCLWGIVSVFLTRDRIGKLMELASFPEDAILYAIGALAVLLLVYLVCHFFHKGVLRAAKGKPTRYLTGLCVFIGICLVPLCLLTPAAAVLPLCFFSAARCHHNLQKQ